MKCLSREFEKEVAGWLTGEVKEDGIYLEDLLIPEQEVGYTSVDIETGAGVKLVKEFGKKCSKIIGHWHSHCNMGCSWSSTDDINMEQIIKPRKFFVFIVTNSKGEYLIRLETKKPFRITADNLHYIIYSENVNKIREGLREELKKKVTETTYQSNTIQTQPMVTSYPSATNRNTNVDNSNLKSTYNNGMLFFEGLSEVEAQMLSDEYKAKKPSVVNSGMDKMIFFKVKNVKKADKIINHAMELIEAFREDLGDFYQDNPQNVNDDWLNGSYYQ